MHLAKPNYAFQKRQRELAKKQKKEEKRLRRQETANLTGGAPVADDAVEATSPAESPGAPPPAGSDGSHG